MIQNIQPHFTHIVNRISTPAWKLPTFTLKAYNIMFIYEGKATFHCNNKRLNGVKGSLIHYRPGDIRQVHSNEDQPMKCYAMDFIYTCPIYENGSWNLYTPPLPINTFEKIDDNHIFIKLVSLFDTLSNTWVGNHRNKIGLCRSTFTEILTVIMDWKSGYSYDSYKVRIVERVIEFISQNYKKKLTLQMLSEAAGISPSYLGSIFREITGTSPINYLMDMRMNRAKSLLLDGNKITDIAALTGFNDVHYFSKYFKKHEGMYPTQYYNANKN